MHSFIPALGLLATTFFTTTVSAAWDLTKNNNLVVYWGQNSHGAYSPDDAKQQTDLVTYCQNTNIDLIVLSFLSNFNSTGGQPVVNFANSCTGFQTFPGTDLLWCPTIAADIQTCQTTYKKKILMSIGGAAGTAKLSSDATIAAAFADTVWNMFGKGWTYYRPFGNAIVDGFDLDIESDPTGNYGAFATRLRTLMATDTSKTYYLTAAPQCPNPDTNLNSALTTASFDAIFVQFYNNPSCGADQWVSGKDQSTNSGFNFGMWDTWVKSQSKNKSAKLFLGLPASGHIVYSGGYVAAATAAKIVADLKRFTSFGGAMLWDASEAYANSAYIPTLRTALGTTAAKRLARRGAEWWWQI